MLWCLDRQVLHIEVLGDDFKAMRNFNMKSLPRLLRNLINVSYKIKKKNQENIRYTTQKI